jgi:hypothetical protein
MKQRKILQPALLAVVLWLAAPAPTEALEWFVAPGGNGSGTSTAPFGRIQTAINAAQPGDVITVHPGTYTETLRTIRDGLAAAPIRLRGTGPRHAVVITIRGRVLAVDHANFIVEGVVLDGQYAAADTVTVNSQAHRLVIRDVEIRRSAQDLIDMSDPHDVLIENCLIHHALNATGGRRDAHGIAAGAVQNLTIRDTEIHTFSGDGLQVDPGRAAPGWDGVTVENVSIWLAPLPVAENGFPAGVVPGENAIDTKAGAALPRSRLTIRNTTAWGFRGGLIGNMAAFNLKEHIDATLDGVTVHDSEIAFRLRGVTPSTAAGAWVTVKNAVVYDVETAFRYENAIENLRILNSTLGRGVGRAFQAASAARNGLQVRNLLTLGASAPEAMHPSNLSVGPAAFVDANAHDYRLADRSGAIDAGEALNAVTADRLGTQRPHGVGHDVGAYEWVPADGARP